MQDYTTIKKDVESLLAKITEMAKNAVSENNKEAYIAIKEKAIEIEQVLHAGLPNNQHKVPIRNKYKELFENAPIANFLVSRTGNIYHLNLAASNLIGLAVEECNKTSIFPYLEDDAKNDFISLIKKVFSEQSICFGELIFVDKNKQMINTRVQARLYLDAEYDKPLCLLAVSDISQIQAYKQLSESKKIAKQHEKQYQTIFYESQTINLLIDSETGNIFDANTSACKYYGYTRDEFKTMNVSEINTLQQVKIAEKMQAARYHNKSHFQFMHRLKSGEYRYVEEYVKPITIGNRVFLHSVIFDVHEKHKAKQEVQKLSAAVEQSSASIVITNTQGSIEYVNPNFTEITGYSKQEAIGRNPRILRTKHTPKNTYKELWNNLKSGKPWSGEFVNRRKDGTLFQEYARIAPIFNNDNEIVSYVAVKEDINNRKKWEKEIKALNTTLQEQNQKLNHAVETINAERNQLMSLFDSIPEFIYVIDPDSLEVLYTNRKMQDTIGRDITGEKCYAAIQNKSEKCSFCKNDILISQESPYYWEYYNESLNKHFYVIDRAIKWIDNKTAFFKMAINITDRKIQESIVEKRLRYEESLAMFSGTLLSGGETALDDALMHILKGVQASRVYLFENFLDNKKRLCTKQSYEAVAEGTSPQINNPDLQKVPYKIAGFQRWVKLLSKDEVITGTIDSLPHSEQAILKQQDIKSILIIPVTKFGKWHGFMGFDDTLTERKWKPEDIKLLRTVAQIIGLFLENRERRRTIIQHNKTLEELNATKDKFFSIIAHDLKSPFNAILGFSSILFDKIDSQNPERLKGMVDTIRQSAGSTYKLLENLLDWARSQTDSLKYEPAVFNIYNAVHELIGLVSGQAAKKQIDILNNTDIKITIKADRNMFNTIVRNLLVNAVKYTERGGSVLVGTKDLGQEVQISVIDTGVGISKENLKKLFSISEKFSEYGTENETGTGLGLILCKEFTEKHGGKIWAESTLGKGSSFHFTLPVAP